MLKNTHYKLLILTKGILLFMLGFFALLVGINNILSFQTNYQFVVHVLSMDTMQPWFKASQYLLGRAITNSNFHLITYVSIITSEILVGSIFIFSACLFFVSLRKINSPNYLYLAKSISLVGSILGLLLWYMGFAIIASEYFSMWGNKFDAQSKSYTFSSFILIATLFVNAPER